MLIVLFITTLSTVSTAALTEDSWNTKTPMTQARAGLGVVAVDGKIYAIGGISSFGNVVGTNERYDPKTDTWVTLKPMPTPRSNFAIAAYQGKIYCISGGGPTEIYDIATDSWSKNKSVAPFSWGTAVTIDEKIFVIQNHELYMFNPATNKWTKKTSMSTFTPHNGISVAVDGKLMVCAGFIEYPIQIEMRVLIYDPKTDMWSDGVWPPFEVGMNAAVATTGVYAPKNVYFMGNLPVVNNYVLGNITVYDPLKNTWSTTNTNSPTGRANYGTTVVDDVLYVIGGVLVGPEGPYYTEETYVTTAINEQYVPIEYGFISAPSETSTTAATSEPNQFTPISTQIIKVVTLVITVGIVMASLIFYYHKSKLNTIKQNQNIALLYSYS
ncbi:MAG: hypothetical protein LBE70_04855, partial [Nitrososphaerota archaeon]|nr:hypothetical protein [Nitrososphaerota archaeon]